MKQQLYNFLLQQERYINYFPKYDKYKQMDKEQNKDNNEQHLHGVKPDKKQLDQQEIVKRRGTVSIEDSKGPPENFYNPHTLLLTVGDGDLSFSASVSEWVRYKYKKNIKKFVATTYDSYDQLIKLYKLNVKTNIKKLEANGVKVFHGIDVNKMNTQQVSTIIDLNKQGFDRIVWNFPHAGFPEKSYGPGFQWEEGFHQKHIHIIDCFFKYSKHYLRQGGLVLMAHKTIEPFSIWNIQAIAQKNNYQMISKTVFNIDDYPGYQNRRGAGKNGGKRFPIQDAVQYVFK